jgi:uncharacterized membrane protein
VLLTAAGSRTVPPGAVLGALLTALLGPSLLLVGFWYLARPHEERAPLPAPGEPAPPRPKWTYVSPWIEAVSAAALVGAIALVWWRYPQLPSRLPTHWNAVGRADGWAAKNLVIVLFPVAMMALVQALLLWLQVAFAQLSARLPAERAEEYRAARDRYLRVWAGWTNLTRLAMLLMFGGILWATLFGVEEQARGAVPPGMIACFVGLALLLGTLPWLLVRVTRERAAMRALAGPGSIESLAPTDGWIAGAIYYNRNDPAVWVEKRVGIGWTLNMARPVSWVFLALILGLPLVLALASVLGAYR